jgi:hypothetical protein
MGKYLKDSFKVLSGAASFASLHSYYQTTQDIKFKTKYDDLLRENRTLEAKINNLQLDSVTDDLFSVKFNALKSQFDSSKGELERISSKMQNIDRSSAEGQTDLLYRSIF